MARESQEGIEIISLGGNAMLSERDNSVRGQEQAANVACEFIADLIDRGLRVLITHGNGPQVGFMKKRVDLAAIQNILHSVPLDYLVANSQGALGYLLEQGIFNALIRKGYSLEDADCIRSMVCRIIAEGLGEKTKPIGEWRTKEEALAAMAANPDLVMKERKDAPSKARGPWREHVYSPKVRHVFGLKDVKTLMDSGTTVVYGGGGGIPVVEGEGGQMGGIEGVVDKDNVTAEIGKGLAKLGAKVKRMSVFTGAPGVIDPEDFASNREQGTVLGELTLSEAKSMLPQLPSGSMKPKLAACLDFVENVEGSEALIAALAECRQALIDGTAGTHIIRGQAWV